MLGFILLVIPGIVMSARYLLWAPVVLLEGLEKKEALKRARTLAARSWRTIIAAMLVQFLVPARYSFVVTAPGFKSVERKGIVLQTSDNKQIDTQLEVGSTTTDITVSAEVPLIDTTAATGSGVPIPLTSSSRVHSSPRAKQAYAPSALWTP